VTEDPIYTQTACDNYVTKVMFMLCVRKQAVSIFRPNVSDISHSLKENTWIISNKAIGPLLFVSLPSNYSLIDILILVYLSTAVGLTPGGSTHLHKRYIEHHN
jgi:hypothetical protein